MYLIGDGQNNYKIGIAINPLQRLRDLNTGNPIYLTLLATFNLGLQNEATKIEQFIHKEMDLSKRQNGEWFKLSSFDIKTLMMVCSDYIKYVPNQDDISKTLVKEEPKKISDENLYKEAVNIVKIQKRASASLLQQKMKIGYARAARLVDLLEERGIVGGYNGAKARILNI